MKARGLCGVRRLCLLVLAGAWGPCVLADEASAAGWAALQRPGAIVLIRHAFAPGVGDPPGMRLGDCASQRNLDARGRDEAARLGERFRQRGVRVGAVLHSPWCRARDTAALAFAGPQVALLREEPVFGSFFGGHGDGERQTRAARDILRRWQGPGVLVVVSHQVNIQGLTGVGPASGQGLVVRVPAGEGPLQVLGQISPQD